MTKLRRIFVTETVEIKNAVPRVYKEDNKALVSRKYEKFVNICATIVFLRTLMPEFISVFI